MVAFFKPKQTQETEAQKENRLILEGMTSVKDVIAPAAMQIEYNFLKLGNYFVRSFFVYSYPRYLYVDWLSPVINIDFSLNTSIFIYPVSTKDTIKKLRSKSAQISATINEDQTKGKVRDPLLETAAEDVEGLRDALQRGESKLFKTSLYFTVFANSMEELNQLSDTLEGMLGGSLVLSKPAIFQQEQGLNACLPLGKDELQVSKNFDTGSISTMFPFASSELSNNEGILYGINLHTSGLVLFDRFKLENANSVVIAKSGSGKSYAVKLELLRYLLLGTEIIVIDPENEYQKLCEAVGGTYLNISINSQNRINPFALPQYQDQAEAEGADELRSNIIMLHGLIRTMVGGELSAEEDSLLDQALASTYASRGITKDAATHGLTPPVMDDLVKVLTSLKGADRLAKLLSKYSTGTYSGLFNQQTNVTLDNKFVVFSIRDLEDELRPSAMYLVLYYIWNLVKSSRKKRILAVDEAWILMKHEDTAQFLFSMAKRSRKYYLGITTIIQEVEDFLTSNYGRAIINNSSLSLLLKQHPAAIDLLSEVFNLTQAEKNFLLNGQVGEGLFFAGQNHVGIQIVPSYQEDLLITTNPEQLNKIEEKT
jgi:conjugal transfer ATP-binding protein TraC